MGKLSRPIPGHPQITQAYGPTGFTAEPPAFGFAHFHLGVDYALACGSTVYSPADGVVSRVGWDDTGYGLVVAIDHADGLRTIVCHLKEALVCKGQRVPRHAEVAYSGTTGNSTGCHLHWSVFRDGQYVNPAAECDLRDW